MQQQISVITLGIADLARSRRFYAGGFGWKPVLETPDIIFYQMNGLMLGTWLASSLADDSRRKHAAGPGANHDDVVGLMGRHHGAGFRERGMTPSYLAPPIQR